MSYTVLARKWRPNLFSEIVGQNHVSQTLKNAILSDRIAHGYIFTGPRGVGKTSAARIFSKALNCNNRNNGEPCNVCQSCREISQATGMDVIEIDGASNNSVDNIRDLRDSIRFLPTSGNYKIYIIDEVHMLSKGAFNALLKTLEEPPEHAIFIFATTEIHKVLPTILSRCQRFDFKRIPIQDIIQRLDFICKEEAITIDQQSLLQIAKKADGGMRDSQSLLDQMISFCGNSITLNDVNATLGILDDVVYFSFAESFAHHDSKRSLELINQLFHDGHDLGEVIFGLEEHLRNLLTVVSTGNTDLIDSTDDIKNLYLEQSKLFSEVDILRIVGILQKTEYTVKTGQNPKIKLELAFAKLCQLDLSRTMTDIIDEDKKKSPNRIISSEKNTNQTESKPLNSELSKLQQVPQDIPINTTNHNQTLNNDDFIPSTAIKTESIVNQSRANEQKLIDDVNPFDSIPVPNSTNEITKDNVNQNIDHQNDKSAQISDKDELPKFTHTQENKVSSDHEIHNEKSELSHNEINPQNNFTQTYSNHLNNSELTKPLAESVNPINNSAANLNPPANDQAEEKSELSVIKDVWERYIESFRKAKPGLYVNLFHSVPKSFLENKLVIYFDTSSRGMLNIQSFDRNKEFITKSFNDFCGKDIQISAEQISFEKLGFKKEFNDIHTVVKNLRLDNEHFDNLISTLGLDIIDVEESNGF